MRCKWLGATLFFILISLAAAQTIGAAEAQSPAEKEGSPSFFLITVLMAGFGMVIGSAAAAFAQSKVIVAALDGIARQPSAAGRIQTSMIIGLAMIESLAIYVLLIALILLFANPFIKFFIP